MLSDSVKKNRPVQLQVPWRSWEALVALLSAFALPIVLYVGFKLIGLSGLLPIAVKNVLFGTSPVTETVWYLIQVISELVFLSLILRKYQLTFRALGIKRFPVLRSIGWVVACYIAFIVALSASFALVSVLFPHANLNQAQVTGFEGIKTGPGVIMGFVVLVILAPIIEEMFFRGLLFPALGRKHNLITAALLSSLIFGIFHAQLNIGIYTGLLGLFLCFLYYRLGSIIPGMSLHMLNNFLAFLVLFKFI